MQLRSMKPFENILEKPSSKYVICQTLNKHSRLVTGLFDMYIIRNYR
jgi:hypothetical protein